MNQSVSMSQQIYQTLTSDSYSRVLWILLALAAVLIMIGMGLKSPWPPDSPRFVEVAREMVDSGQWLIPMRGGEPYPDKPPVFMWGIAFFYWLTGDLKTAFLLPNALCSLFVVYLVFDLAARLWNVRVARNAVLLLLLVPQFIIQSKNAQIDAMVACWITVGCYGLIRHFMTGPAWGWYFTGWAFMGLGIITKGVGFLPILMLIPVFWLMWRDRSKLACPPSLACLLGPLVMLAVAALWLVPMVLYVDAQGSDMFLQYRDNILFKQTGERYANSWGHIQPWYYFFTDVIPSLWFPLPLLLLAGLGRVRKAFARDPAIFIMLSWVLLVIVFFSISPGKRGVYILPALPMTVIALSAALTGQRLGKWFRPTIGVIQAVLGLALITVGTLAWFDLPKLVEKVSEYSNGLGALHQAGSLLIVVGIAWLAALVLLWRQHALLRLFVALSFTWIVMSTWGYAILDPLKTPRNVLANVEHELAGQPNAQLGLIDFKEQFILFSKLDVTHFSYFSSLPQEERNAWRWMHEGKQRYVLAADDLSLKCFRLNGGTPVGIAHSKHWLLLSADQMTKTCQAPTEREQFTTPNPGRWLDR